MKLVFLGPPASGKGTQARQLADERALPYLGTGALLRQAMREDSPLGREARVFLDRGQYLPDAVMIPLVLEWLDRQDGGWVLDGFPRSLAQAEALEENFPGEVIPVVLEVPSEELELRVTGRRECPQCHWTAHRARVCNSCGGTMLAREDDSASKFRARLAAYRENVLPVVARYQELGVAKVISGSGSPTEVANAVRAELVGVS